MAVVYLLLHSLSTVLWDWEDKRAPGTVTERNAIQFEMAMKVLNETVQIRRARPRTSLISWTAW